MCVVELNLINLFRINLQQAYIKLLYKLLSKANIIDKMGLWSSKLFKIMCQNEQILSLAAYKNRVFGYFFF